MDNHRALPEDRRETGSPRNRPDTSHFRDIPSLGDAGRVAGMVARAAIFTVADRIHRPAVRERTQVPARIEDITPEWLTAVLCGTYPDTRVIDVSFDDGSSGTSVRSRLHLQYNDLGAESRLPGTLFAKSTPTLVTRIANGITGTARAEAGFYRELRPLLTLQAPRGHHCATDPRSFRTIHLLEDLVATKNAAFWTPTTAISRSQAEQIVGELARLHGAAAALPLVGGRRPAWLVSYPQWWQAASSATYIRRYHHRGQASADDEGITPPRLRGRSSALWQKFVASIDAHRDLSRTLIHGDVHLGNWYVTGSGAMGLCDWQCVSVGHWSRDLAYALVTALTIDQRRSWERELIALYSQRLGEAGGDVLDSATTWDLYRQQTLGALVMWTPTHDPPRFLPAMQPKSMTTEMLRRILTAVDDLEAIDL
jgi:aminoglycoside phosphotransferase (APT) family kinase protein